MNNHHVYRIEPRWLQEKHYTKTCMNGVGESSVISELKNEVCDYLKRHGAVGDTLEAKLESVMKRIDDEKVGLLKEMIEFINKEYDCSILHAEGTGRTPFCHFMHHKRRRRSSLKMEEGSFQEQDQDQVESNEKECLKQAKNYLFEIRRWGDEFKQLVVSGI